MDRDSADDNRQSVPIGADPTKIVEPVIVGSDGREGRPHALTATESGTAHSVAPPPGNGHARSTGRVPGPSLAVSTKPSHLKRTIWVSVSLALFVGLAVGSYFGYRYLDTMINYVTTDNAQVASQNVPVGSTNAGRVASLRVDVGAQVRTGDVLAQIELPSAVRTLQNGAPDLEYLGAADQRTNVISPMNGVVVAVPAAVDQTISQGQPLVVLIDPARVWVNANVDENQISKVRLGQTAQTYVAAAKQTISGTVVAITPATAASFFPAPQANATGDYTNPGQLVTVKISVDEPATMLFAGATAQVRIRVT